jgi:hypothetical protein
MSAKPHRMVQIDPKIRAEGQEDPAGVMAYFFVLAFGVSLPDIRKAIDKMIDDRNTALLYKCLAAAVQINGNVTWLSDLGQNPDPAYEVFVIQGQRDGVQNYYNFTALHIAGHLVCHLSTAGIAKRALKKGGSCIVWSEDGYPPSEAGKVNKETAAKWDKEDVQDALSEPPRGINKLIEDAVELGKEKRRLFSEGQQRGQAATRAPPAVPQQQAGVGSASAAQKAKGT